MSRDGYRRGGFWRIDDRTGFRVRAERTAKEWDGTIVAREEFEARHPQDFVRGKRDNMQVPDARPEPTDQFQAPDGGPFILIESEISPMIRIDGGNINIVYASNTAQISPSDL